MSKTVSPGHLHFPVSSKAITLRAITLPSVIEPPVSVFFDGQEIGKFQGIELYQQCHFTSSPQLLVDLVANLFFRLSYIHSNHKTATFATSVAGTPSFRNDDGVLNYLPTIKRAIVTEQEGEIIVEIQAEFAHRAKVVSLRKYSTKNPPGITEMDLSVYFEALDEIALDPRSMGSDAFRFFSLSSMYAGDIFDADFLTFTAHDGAEDRHEISEFTERSHHFFSRSLPVGNTIQLTNRGTSKGPSHGPGAKDAPSYRIVTEKAECSSPSGDVNVEIGLQGYYTKSDDVNADSLSVWLEWRNAPLMIRKGTTLRLNAKVSAFDGRKV